MTRSEPDEEHLLTTVTFKGPIKPEEQSTAVLCSHSAVCCYMRRNICRHPSAGPVRFVLAAPTVVHSVGASLKQI